MPKRPQPMPTYEELITMDKHKRYYYLHRTKLLQQSANQYLSSRKVYLDAAKQFRNIDITIFLI